MSPALRDLGHLAKRFATSITAQPLSISQQEWVDANLLPGERMLWLRMSTPDQRHAYGVARRVTETLGPNLDRAVVAAALMHDIGKIESGLGTVGRSIATVAANLGSTNERVARYRSHNEIGRELLRRAGSDELTSTWAYEHELPSHAWTIEPSVAAALHDADDD